VLIPSGIKVNVPNGYVLNFENKSGVASKKHLLFGSKVIDAGYEGIVHVNLHNVGTHTVTIDAGEKIAQALMYKIEVPVVEVVDEQVLYNGVKSERGEGGFGSTGEK
jgi:dUTP pyrophosphatase